MHIVGDAVDGVSVCVPGGCVEWYIQVSIAEEVGIIRNGMDNRRRVERWLGSVAVGYSSLTSQSHWLGAFAQLEVWWIEGDGWGSVG